MIYTYSTNYRSLMRSITVKSQDADSLTYDYSVMLPLALIILYACICLLRIDTANSKCYKCESIYHAR
jgi:hypothetical protein